jgi:hypothetical protein
MIAEINQLHRPAMIVLDGLKASWTAVREGMVEAASDALGRSHCGGRRVWPSCGCTGNATIHGVASSTRADRPRRDWLGAKADQIDLVTDDPESRKIAERVQDVLKRG